MKLTNRNNLETKIRLARILKFTTKVEIKTWSEQTSDSFKGYSWHLFEVDTIIDWNIVVILGKGICMCNYFPVIMSCFTNVVDLNASSFDNCIRYELDTPTDEINEKLESANGNVRV